MLHVVGGPPDSGLLPLVLLVAALGSALVIAIALAALARRRSLSYFLVTVALATMLTRTLVGILGVNNVISELPHHVIEHGLDIFTVIVLLGAVYAARTVDPRTDALADGGNHQDSAGTEGEGDE